MHSHSFDYQEHIDFFYINLKFEKYSMGDSLGRIHYIIYLREQNV